MVRKIGILAALVVLIVWLAGCSVFGAPAMNCAKTSNLSEGHETCSGTIDTLESSHVLVFDVSGVAVGATINAQFTISITRGAVRIIYPDKDGNTVFNEAIAGRPLTITQTMRLDSGSEVKITLEENGGTASGIGYSVEFTR